MGSKDDAAAVKRQEEADAAPPYEISTAGPSSSSRPAAPSVDDPKMQVPSEQSASGSAAPPTHQDVPEMDAPAAQVSPQPHVIIVADSQDPVLADRIIKYRARMRLLEAYLYAVCIYLILAMFTGMVVDSATAGGGNGGNHKHRNGDRPGLPPHWPPREGEW